MLKLRFRTKAGDAGGDANYEKSNAITTLPAGRFSSTYRTAILTAKRDTAEHRTALANALVDHICKVYGIPPVRVSVTERTQWKRTTERGTLKSKTLGVYTHTATHAVGINIPNLTAVKAQRITNKGFLNTLLHEVNHHLDYALLHLTKSLHTAGFYKRISDLDSKLRGR